MQYKILLGIVFAVMVIAELATFQLVSIWFAAGAASAFIAAMCGFGMGFQLFMFIVVSVLLLSVTRPILKKFTANNIQPTNTELDIGKTATVIEEINNVSCTGRARLNGVDCNAVSSDDTVIKAGSVVKINDIKGTKLYVSLYIEEKSSVK